MIMVIAFALLVVTLVVAVRARPDGRAVSRLGPVAVETVTDVSAPTTTVDELAVWQRAVWEVAVWEQAIATTTTAAIEVERDIPNPVSHDGGCPSEIVAIIREAFAGTGMEDWALRIAWRESNCQPGVVSGEGALGLFQLLGHDDLFDGSWDDPVVNARAARALYDQCSTGPWEPPYWC